MADPNDGESAVVSEAEAQREETVMPWLWGGAGLVVIAAFVVWTLLAVPGGHVPRNPPAAAPLTRPPHHGY
jgi:hypothetical protein